MALKLLDFSQQIQVDLVLAVVYPALLVDLLIILVQGVLLLGLHLTSLNDSV